MIRHFDHVTIVVRDLAPAVAFFELLGFALDKTVVISGPQMERYMGIDGIEADHVTLALPQVSPRVEVQLLHYRRPDPIPDPYITNLSKLGFNHVCFAVDDLAGELRRLAERGIKPRNDVMHFHDRDLVYLAGPEGITLELAQWTPR